MDISVSTARFRTCGKTTHLRSGLIVDGYLHSTKRAACRREVFLDQLYISPAVPTGAEDVDEVR